MANSYAEISDYISPAYMKRRFNELVIRQEGCWGWRNKVDPNPGYPRVTFKRSYKLHGHIVSWLIHHPDQPIGDSWVLHSCDNKVCTNPDHLYLGDQWNNGSDIIDRETSRKEFCKNGHSLGEDGDVYIHKRQNKINGQWYVARICNVCRRSR